jgi:hypothetical protein
MAAPAARLRAGAGARPPRWRGAAQALGRCAPGQGRGPWGALKSSEPTLRLPGVPVLALGLLTGVPALFLADS